MSGPAAILKQLHHLRQHATDLDERIASAPRQLIVQQKKLANAEDAFKAAQENLKRMLLDIREKEGSVKATQTQTKKYEKQLDAAANKKEYDTLKLEIANEQAHVSKLEDEILVLMGQHEEKTGQLPEVEKTTQKARADFAKFEKDHQVRVAQLADEKAKAMAELQTTVATLPADIKPQYDRLIAAKGTDSIAAVNGRSCAACYTEVTSQMLSELKRDVFMLCKNCGRMLYLQS